MTLQDLLKHPRSNTVSTQNVETNLETQRAKTAQLIAANKAVAAKILKDTLLRIDSNNSVTTEKERKIWI